MSARTRRPRRRPTWPWERRWPWSPTTRVDTRWPGSSGWPADVSRRADVSRPTDVSRRQPKAHRERRSALRCRSGRRRPAQPVGEPGDECQTESGPDPAPAAVALVEGGAFEGDRAIGLGQAWSAVPNLEHGRVRPLPPYRQHDRRPRRRDPQRVLREPVQDLPNPSRIGLHENGFRCQLEPQLDSGGLTAVPPRRFGGADELDEVDGLEIDPEVLGAES